MQAWWANCWQRTTRPALATAASPVEAGVRVATQILGLDDKRLHLGHEMFALDGGHRTATQELMFLHVDLVARRVSPFPDDLPGRIAVAATAHAALPRPDWIGRRIAMPGTARP